MRIHTVLLYFLQTVLHVSDDTLIHHQEDIQTVITTSGTGRRGYHPKHVELSAENIIKLYIGASCWTIIEIDSRCTGP